MSKSRGDLRALKRGDASLFSLSAYRSHKQIGKFLNAMRKSKAIEVTEKKGVIHVSKVVDASIRDCASLQMKTPIRLREFCSGQKAQSVC